MSYRDFIASTLAPLFGGIVGNMLGRVIAISSVLAVVALAIALQITAPTTAGPLGILFVFILIYLSVLGVLTFLLFFVGKLIAKTSTVLGVKRVSNVLTLRRAYYFSSVLALAPVIFVGMQSVGTVGVYDLLLLGIFVVVACIYIARRTS